MKSQNSIKNLLTDKFLNVDNLLPVTTENQKNVK